jgi:ribosomal protein L37AE/L43A
MTVIYTPKRGCVRCGGNAVTRYSLERFYCLTCGQTFHADSHTLDEENARRAAADKGGNP